MSHYEELAGEMLQELLDAMSQEMGRLSRDLLEKPEFLGSFQKLFSQYGHLLTPGAGAPPSAVAYGILGLDSSSTDDQVRKRYRELAKRLHPDVAGQETEHLFKLVQSAYEQISRERGWKKHEGQRPGDSQADRRV